ncbi:MAG: ATP-binding cassette domain-containing protein, partial [Deltaproteobacteria bacterium]|nr:ATP-binding cassette domain-containing protein [Deltaproteobacteria bacterium]
MAESIVELSRVFLDREKSLLHDLNWEVFRGQHWMVLGRNGAGKTLLLRIIAGYLWPSQGQVRVLGRQYGEVDLRRLRREIGWVSAALTEQIPLRDSVLEVVLSGGYATFGLYQSPTDDLVTRARTLISDLDMADLENQKFGTLSAGEKQRVVLARACLPNPSLLILDEPCTGLDLAARE